MIQLPSIPQYLLESSICLLVFYGLYHLVLRHETYFQFNRIYLISSCLLSLALPVLSIDISSTTEGSGGVQNIIPIIQYTAEVQQNIQHNIEHNSFYSISIGDIIRGVFYIGVFLMTLKFLHSLFQVFDIIQKSQKRKNADHTLLTSKSDIPASSFFSYIFWNDEDEEQDDTTQKTILNHELVHVKQWHSLDVIVMEIMVIIKWFNPLIYLFRNSLRRTHEYIADHYVSQQMGDKHGYAMILLNQYKNHKATILTSTFSTYIQDRIAMLARVPSKGWSLAKPFLALPVGMALMALFSFNMTEHMPNDIKDGLSAIESGIQKASNQVVVNLSHSKRAYPWEFKWGDKIYARPNKKNTSKFAWNINDDLSLHEIYAAIERRPIYMQNGVEIPVEFEMKITSESDTVSNVKFGRQDVQKSRTKLKNELLKHQMPFSVRITDITSKDSILHNGFTFSVYQTDADKPTQDKPQEIVFKWGDMEMTANNSLRMNHFVPGRMYYSYRGRLMPHEPYAAEMTKSEFLEKVDLDLNILADGQSINWEDKLVTLTLFRKEFRQSSDHHNPPAKMKKDANGAVAIHTISNVYHGRSFKSVAEDYNYNDIKHSGSDYLDALLMTLSDGDQVGISYIDTMDQENKYLYFSDVKIKDEATSYHAPYEVDLPPTSDTYTNFQILHSPSDDKTYVKVDTTQFANKNIVKAYRNSQSYELVHVPNFKTKIRVNDSREIPAGILTIDPEMELKFSALQISQLNEHYTDSDRFIRMDWGRMVSMPGIGNFSINEFRRSSAANFMLVAGDVFLNTVRFDAVIISEGKEPVRLRSDNIKSIMCRKAFAEIDGASSIYFDNIIINDNDEYKWYPFQFVFNLE